jgi:hypothetical protein
MGPKEEGIMIRKSVFLGLMASLYVIAAACGVSGAGTVTADDLTFTMPAGWIAKEAPGMKAYQVLMYQGKPVGEMYLAKEPLLAPKTPSQMLEEGLRKNASSLQNYQPLETMNLTVAGLDAILHDYVYYLPQSSVPFTGRVVVTVVNDAAYTFFFNTTSNYFPAVKGAFMEIIASIRSIPRPTPGEQPSVVTQKGPRKIEEHGFVMELASGWIETNDPAGAKYRFYGPDKKLVASFFPFDRDEKSAVDALFAIAGKSDPLEAVLNGKIATSFKTFGDYAPLGTKRRTVAGCDAIVHDFSFKQGEIKGVYHWCIVAVKDKPDVGTQKFAPSCYSFAFVTYRPEKFAELTPVFDVILDSATLAKPLPSATASVTPGATATNGAAPKPTPDEQTLPQLPDVDRPDTFRDPAGRFTVTLPKGATKDREPRIENMGETGETHTYSLPGVPDAMVILHVFEGEPAGLAWRDLLTAELDARDSGTATWTVGGRKVPVDLFVTGDNQVLVTAVFGGDGLAVGVRVPREKYAPSQGWIKALIGGVTFR